MSGQRPSFEEYKEWLQETLNVALPIIYEGYYETVTIRMSTEFEQSAFWRRFTGELGNYNDIYLQQTGYRLINNFKPEILKKPYNSFLLKTYRKNIIDNKKFPDPPSDGWFIPDNWFSRINDLIRTLIEVKYLDGVKFLIEKMEYLCKEMDIRFDFHLEAREEGYYAAHFYIPTSFEIPKITWDTEIVTPNVEIQITTQLQEVIRQLLHEHYEVQRASTRNKRDWQWDYRSNEFAANYLGHILHYLEGIIVEVRDKQQKNGDKK